MVRVKLSWRGAIYDVEVDLGQSLELFKAQIYSLTEVPVFRQKILGLKSLSSSRNDVNLKDLGVKDGMKLILLGTPEGHELKITELPTQNDSHADKPELETNDPQSNEPLGLSNPYQFSCYLNAVIQFLKPCQEFIQAIKSLPSTLDSSDPGARLCSNLKDLYRKLDESTEPIFPTAFIESVMICHPPFAEENEERSSYAHQDPEEFLSVLLDILSQKMLDDTIDQLFKFTYEATLKNVDDPTDEYITTETGRILPCHVGTFSNTVRFWSEGVQQAHETTLTKLSSSGVNATYKKTLKLSLLPKYLIIHCLRFEWKKSSELNRTKAGRAKVCRRVEFERCIDVYQFCSDSVKKQLDPFRPKFDNNTPTEQFTVVTGSDGTYELQAVITHIGRSADTGHCIAWVKNEKDEWFKLDDQTCTRIDIRDYDLWGGRADYHIATLTLYKRKEVECKVINSNASD